VERERGECQRPIKTITQNDHAKKLTEVVLEGKVQSLSREVTEHVGGVTTPEGSETLVPVGPAEAVTDTFKQQKRKIRDQLIMANKRSDKV
jgi:hypothetical protein